MNIPDAGRTPSNEPAILAPPKPEAAHRWPPGVLLEHTRLDFLETLGLDDVRWLVP